MFDPKNSLDQHEQGTGMKDINKTVFNTPFHKLLSRISGEFNDNELEHDFLKASWEDIKKSVRNAFFMGGLIFMAFSIVDQLSELSYQQLHLAFFVRSFSGLVLIGSGIYIQQKKQYFKYFHLLLLINQVGIAVAIIYVGEIRNLVFIHNAFHVFMTTLIYYQFLHNRFSFTMLACVFFPAAYLLVNLGQYDMEFIDTARFILYLILANGLGIMMLSSLNKNRRKQYIQFMKEQHLNHNLETTVERLTRAQEEIKTLQGIIPICSHCKNIRDDKGYWDQMESYIQKHSKASFSHSICPDCSDKIYGKEGWYIKLKKEVLDLNYKCLISRKSLFRGYNPQFSVMNIVNPKDGTRYPFRSNHLAFAGWNA